MFAPEENYYSMVCGAGPAPMLAYGDVLLAHHASMTAVVGVSSGTATTTAAAWQGLGGSAAQAALVEHNTEHLVLADETLAKAQIAHLAAATHTATVTRMVPAPPAHANRLEEAADELINPLVWGALTPRIADLNLEYFGFMWPNNAAAGVSYGVALDGFGVALMAPSLPAVSGGSPGAVAAAAASLAEGAGLSAGQAGLQAAESGAMEVLSPASAAPAAALSAVSSVASAPAAQPLAAVQHTPSVSAQQLAPAQTSVGMFAQPPVASVMAPPAAPNPAATESPAAQLLTPRPAPVAPPMPAAAPGVTSFVPPAQPFAPPPPTAGRAAGLKPGMLNASALRGPVSTMPLTTTATSSLATATQPLAYVPPEPPRPPVPPTPPQPPLLNPGETAHTLNPPPQPQQTPPNNASPPQPAAPHSSPPPGPSTGSGGPDGSGGPGVQMPGSGPGQAPQAPPLPIPLDTRAPVPPPPSPGEPPLRHPSPPSWASPPVPKSVQAAQDELKDLERLIQQHNNNPPNTSDPNAVALYNSEADYYNAWAAQLEGQLASSNAGYTPATTAKTAEIPSWTQPAPPQPPDRPPPPYTGPSTPELIDEVPLQTDLRQIEEKYSQHASDFGVSDPRGRAGFDKFADAVKQMVHDPSTLHIKGTYHRQPVILNYNPDSGLCVIQDLDGQFISGWELSSKQAQNVLTRGSL
jgi:hypothetical protein